MKSETERERNETDLHHVEIKGAVVVHLKEMIGKE
jgi:hypothetical protein